MVYYLPAAAGGDQQTAADGGAIDAFVCYPGHERIWHERWTAVTDADGDVITGKAKGYAEVAW